MRLVGGLGNQLHCYAFGYAIAKQNGASLRADCVSGYWNDPYGRQYLLDAFPNLRVNKKALPKSRLGRVVFKLILGSVTKLSRLVPLAFRFVVTEPKPPRYCENIHRTRYWFNPYFMGYWASFHYYQDIAAELRNELAPPRPSHPDVLHVLREIESGRSCAIHWRSYAEERGGARASMLKYYQAAIRVARSRHPDIRFFVFTDNHAAARFELQDIGEGVEFVALKEAVGDFNSLNDFYLMYSCDHAIIGDSTFSWWAAWLGDRAEKMVIAPQGLSPWGADWAPSHWIKIGA